MSRKTYEKPAVVQTQKITTRAVACDKESDTTCAGGVISS